MSIATKIQEWGGEPIAGWFDFQYMLRPLELLPPEAPSPRGPGTRTVGHECRLRGCHKSAVHGGYCCPEHYRAARFSTKRTIT